MGHLQERKYRILFSFFLWQQRIKDIIWRSNCKKVQPLLPVSKKVCTLFLTPWSLDKFYNFLFFLLEGSRFDQSLTLAHFTAWPREKVFHKKHVLFLKTCFFLMQYMIKHVCWYSMKKLTEELFRIFRAPSKKDWVHLNGFEHPNALCICSCSLVQ